jgi:UDP-N-acetylmuramoylalanine--D-glutamate ligase
MENWDGRKIVILGAARQGIALANYFISRGASVVLNDIKPANELLSAAREALDRMPASFEGVFGSHPVEILDSADLLCLSGGVPLDLPIVEEARRRSIPLSNDAEIFMEVAPCRVIGVTGSAGKTTTTTLVGRIAEAAVVEGVEHLQQIPQGQDQLSARPGKVWVGGNIGSPLISVVDQMGTRDLTVMELSSFQLELMNHSPQVAAVLNITPNHLDRHGSMQAYSAAKSRILAFQSQKDVSVLNREDPGAWALVNMVQGKLVTFGLEKPEDGWSPPAKKDAGWSGTYRRADGLYYWNGEVETRLISREHIGLRGEHNLLNVSAACAIAAAADLPFDAMQQGVQGFQGVPHRLEFVRKWRGANWYNDSIATAPERAMAAIRSFDEPIVLLAGGRDKNLPWDEFAHLARKRVDHLILFGEVVEKISQALDSDAAAHADLAPGPLTITRCQGLEGAVAAAARLVRPGDVVLLSPGGTSFDEFRDFEERGECFKRLVRQL